MSFIITLNLSCILNLFIRVSNIYPSVGLEKYGTLHLSLLCTVQDLGF